MALLLLPGCLPTLLRIPRGPECECVVCVVREMGRKRMPISAALLASQAQHQKAPDGLQGNSERRGKVRFSWPFSHLPLFFLTYNPGRQMYPNRHSRTQAHMMHTCCYTHTYHTLHITKIDSLMDSHGAHTLPQTGSHSLGPSWPLGFISI